MCKQLFWVAACVTLASTQCNDGPVIGLLYTSLAGQSWRNNDRWGPDGVGHCEYYGVVCDSVESGCVNTLKLELNQLSGSLPTEIGNLTKIKVLQLVDNPKLYGTIPSELVHATALTSLRLRLASLSGTIPTELGKLRALQELDLGGNLLSGTIPIELANLPALTEFGLDYNNLIGTIPSEIGGITNLFGLYLNNNQLSGTIPSELGKLGSLNYLYLDGNQLSGTLPSFLANMTKSLILHLSANKLSGSIPSAFGDLPGVEAQLYNNTLTGTIPIGFCRDQVLDNLANNCLSVTDEICKCQQWEGQLGSQSARSQPCPGVTANRACSDADQ